MKAQTISSFGDCSVFETVDVAVSKIKPGYALIRVLATSVNPVDCKVWSGMYGHIAPEFPAILHGEVAGGAELMEFSIGGEVYIQRFLLQKKQIKQKH